MTIYNVRIPVETFIDVEIEAESGDEIRTALLGDDTAAEIAREWVWDYGIQDEGTTAFDKAEITPLPSAHLADFSMTDVREWVEQHLAAVAQAVAELEAQAQAEEEAS